MLLWVLVACAGNTTLPDAPATATATPVVTTVTVQPATPLPTATPALAPTTNSAACADATLDLRVVDKQRALPRDEVPASLVRIDARWSVPGLAEQALLPDPASAIVQLLQRAADAGHVLRIRSTYRSYEEQERTFQFWIDRLGEAQARRESAPPGHSEHQLGTTVDVSSAAVNWELITPFGETPEGQWLAEHAYRFGFALSYPQDAEQITGYIWEPWHLRYIGATCAAQWHASGQVLVRFLEALR
jgi:D-alanyl-D-alanine carboxypeptidase